MDKLGVCDTFLVMSIFEVVNAASGDPMHKRENIVDADPWKTGRLQRNITREHDEG